MKRQIQSAQRPRIARLAVAVMCCLSPAVFAATITVDNQTAASVSGACTIVDAVASINQGHTVSGSSCVNTGAAFGVDDTIGFSSNFTINFSSPAGNANSALVLNKTLTISGRVNSSGKPVVTIARKNAAKDRFRIIEANANLVLSGVTVRGGDVNGDGGGVFVTAGATVSINNAAITNNAADDRGGGVYASNGLVTLNASTISGNTAPTYGGGIYSYAGVTLVHSTVSDNRSGQGAGVLSIGAFSADASTISGNTAAYVGGGIYTFATAALTDTTLSGNSAVLSGGGMSAYDANLKFCTISGNSVDSGGAGAGVYLRGNNEAATATLIFGNANGNDIEGRPFIPMHVTGDHNLIGSHSPLLAVPGDTSDCDPGLGPLSDNGGPTLTRALGSGSCAIDAGPAVASISTDQRDYARKAGAATDIGAVEMQAADVPDRVFAGSFE